MTRLKMIVALVVAALVSSATPAQAIETRTKAHILKVRLTETGSIRVTFDYRCPKTGVLPVVGHLSGFQYRPIHGPAVADNIQFLHRFRRDIICDGMLRALVERVHPPDGDRFMLRWPLSVQVHMFARDPYSDGTFFQKGAAYDLVSTGLARVAMEMAIRRIRVLDSGRLQVAVSYACPAESLGLDDFNFHADQDEGVYGEDAIDVRGVRACDGTVYRLRAYFGADADWNRRDPIVVNGGMSASTPEASPDGSHGIYSSFESIVTVPTG